MISGTVKFILPNRGRVAVLTEAKDFSILVLFTPDAVQIEDQLAWEHDGDLGHVQVENKTRGGNFEALHTRQQIAAEDVGAALVG